MKTPDARIQDSLLRTSWLPLSCLGTAWLAGVWRLHYQWLASDDYTYGWIVPALALFLLSERWATRPAQSPSSNPSWLILIFGGLAALLPVRLALESSPLWPAALWLYTLTVIAVTLGIAGYGGGKAWAKHFAFPAFFLLSAAPWPSGLTSTLVDSLMPTVAAAATAIVNLLGYPALVQGNIIQVGKGFVGVDEACSGLRSVQTTVMVALFLGEFYRLGLGRRITLAVCGLGLAFLTNLLRTVFLTWQGASNGPGAVTRWHDTAGYGILVVCIGGLLTLGGWWSRGNTFVPTAVKLTSGVVIPRWIPSAILGLLICSELCTEFWYASREAQRPPQHQWDLALPTYLPSYQPVVIDETSRRLLRYDSAKTGMWNAPDGTERLAYFFNWDRGETARYIPFQHNPEICLPMAGLRLQQRLGDVTIDLASQRFVFQGYVFGDERRSFYVFYTVWQSGASGNAPGAGFRGWWHDQVGDVLSGRRHQQGKLLTYALFDMPDKTRAEDCLRHELGNFVKLR
ncbi:MAG TPA: exosortase/archaeosortase family protein [Opitutaceae bacterium]|nr:exosortase/archaeosortase family protein [Opitutaceae bacterium]